MSLCDRADHAALPIVIFMETLRLHYAPDNASLVVRLALEELQLRYETILVDRSRNAQKSAAYRSINPAGKIPVLETSTGPIFETAAILLYLADQSSRLAPQADSHDRGAFLGWLFYLSNTLHTNLRLTFHPQSYVGSDKTLVEPLRDGARRALIESLHLLDDLAGASYPWLNEPQPSVLDFYLAAMLRWMALYPVTIPIGFRSPTGPTSTRWLAGWKTATAWPP